MAIPDRKKGTDETAERAPASVCDDLSLTWTHVAEGENPMGRGVPLKGVSHQTASVVRDALKWIDCNIVHTMKYSAI